MKKTQKIPKKRGIINIHPEVLDAYTLQVVIIGDPDGLKYLASLLTWLAEYDQESSDAPEDTREHIHLAPGYQLDSYSCKVELCRADAKGSGKFPSSIVR